MQGLNVVDLQLATYEENPEGHPSAFVDVVRLSTSEAGLAPRELADQLRQRLLSAFAELSKGDVESALSAASDSTRTNSVSNARVWTPIARRNDDLAGVTLNDEYVLQKLLGTGGMSDVYLAEQISLGRPVAVKLLKRQPDSASDRDVQARFARETAVVARFDCPQIVAVLGSGVWNQSSSASGLDGALEYMPSGDLSSFIRRQGPPPEDTGCSWFRQALQGLSYAHAQGVLHRDLKPHNLLLNFAGELKLTDFGLLKEQFLPNDGRTLAGQNLRHAALYVTRTGLGRCARRAIGHLLARRDILRSLCRQGGLRPSESDGPAAENQQRRRPLAIGHPSPHQPTDGGHHRQNDGSQPRRAISGRRRDS